MSGHAGDIARCWRCGEKVDRVFDWRGREVMLALHPDPTLRPTFFEPELGEFRPVHRHVCLPKPPPEPNDGRELLRPITARRPKRAAAQPQPDLFTPFSATAGKTAAGHCGFDAHSTSAGGGSQL